MSGKTFEQELLELPDHCHPETVVLEYKEGVSQSDLASGMAEYGIIINNLPAIRVATLKVAEGCSVHRVLAALRGHPLLASAHLNQYGAATATPTDPAAPLSAKAFAALHMYEAWDYQPPPGVTIAVIDSGVYREHPDLNVIGGAAFNLGDGSGGDPASPWYRDDNGHGTACAGSAAAIWNNTAGSCGTNPGGGIYAIRITLYDEAREKDAYTPSALDIAAAIIHATDSGIRVVSMSFAFPYTRPIELACEYAISKGVCLVAAAGNESLDSGRSPWCTEIVAIEGTKLLGVKFPCTADATLNGVQHSFAINCISHADGKTYVELTSTLASWISGFNGSYMLQAQPGTLDWRVFADDGSYSDLTLGADFIFDPAYYRKTDPVQYPSSYMDVISVSGTGGGWPSKDLSVIDYGCKAAFANLNRATDVCAPAVMIYVTCSPFATDPYDTVLYDQWNGTSFAAPYTAGIVAQMIHRNPSLTPQQVLSTLVSTATYGILDHMGTAELAGMPGQVNAYAALVAVSVVDQPQLQFTSQPSVQSTTINSAVITYGTQDGDLSEAVSTIVNAGVSVNDVHQMIEDVTTVAQSAISTADTLKNVETLLAQIQTLPTVSELYSQVQQIVAPFVFTQQPLVVSSTANSVTLQYGTEDINQDVSVTGISDLKVTEIFTRLEILLATIQALPTVADLIQRVEAITVSATTQASAVDDILSGIFENVCVAAQGVSSTSDMQLMVDSISMIAKASNSLSEIAAFVESVASAATAKASVVDVIRGPFLGRYIFVNYVTPRLFNNMCEPRSFVNQCSVR